MGKCFPVASSILRMCLVASSPSNRGICTSMRTTSKLSRSTATRASLPLVTVVTLCPARVRRLWETSRFTRIVFSKQDVERSLLVGEC